MRELTDQRYEMAEEYADTGLKIAELKIKRAEYVLGKRASGEAKSYADAERAFEITDEGKDLMRLEYKFKGLDKLLSAIKTRIEAGFKGY